MSGKPYQFYATPPPLAHGAAQVLEETLGKPLEGIRLLEPSAGRGALALAARRRGAIVTCVESHPDRAQHLRKLGFETLETDFLDLQTLLGARFEAVLMNPPFYGEETPHLLKAWRLLEWEGALACFLPPRIKHPPALKAWLEKEKPKTLPGKAFASACLGRELNLVCLKKHHQGL